jgi:hypothetical protein
MRPSSGPLKMPKWLFWRLLTVSNFYSKLQFLLEFLLQQLLMRDHTPTLVMINEAAAAAAAALGLGKIYCYTTESIVKFYNNGASPDALPQLLYCIKF